MPMDGKDWQALGVFAALIGVAVNGYFNVKNWRRTENATRRVEHRTLAAENYRTNTSTPIVAGLAKFHPRPAELRTALAGARTEAARRARVKTVQDESYKDFRALVFLLDMASRNDAVDGNDWSEVAAEHWDNFLSALDTLYAPDVDRGRQEEAFRRAERALADMCLAISNKLDAALRAVLDRADKS